MVDYQDALDWIYSFANWETRTAAGGEPPGWDLARVEAVLAAAGNPHQRYPTVHVAGTKGKGSTAAMITSVLHAAGYRTGLYTSPHLHTFRERMWANGRMISRAELGDLVERFRPIVAEVPRITTFEVVTAMAFAYFALNEVDVAVIEVGLGGRLDATNVIIPLVSVITSLSLDHTALLGDSLAEIAREKAGIVKPGVPVVSAPQPPDARAVIEQVAEERDAPLIVVGRDWIWRPGSMTADGQEVEITRVGEGKSGRRADGEEKTILSPPHSLTSESMRLWVPLIGRHQLVNATVAVAALEVVRSRGFEIPGDVLRSGLAATRWPGRLEILSRQPLLIVDGAHNTESARRLVEALGEWFGQRRRLVVFGASFDKDIGGMLDVLVPGSDCVIIAQSRHPRRSDLGDLAARVEARGGRAITAGSVAGAVERALDMVGPDGLICVTGSLFVVAEAREMWLERGSGPKPECDPPPVQ